MSRISQSHLEGYLWGAAEHLRGSIDAGDYKQFIFPLLFLKRLCDVHDEETAQALRNSGGDAEFAAFAENHRFLVPSEAHWKEIRKETRNVGQAIQRAMRAIESANKDKLFGIFGDAQWSNKDRLSDATMRELIEHFSSLELTIENLPEDELGQGYEFLIKKFADDSGHTAAEFYTNRTVVHLMTEMLDVQPGESVYDPTCGSGGMLMSCVAHLRKQGKEWRNVRLFGQERNLMTSSIARMNCFLHGIEDFRIERGDTLAEPKLVEGDKLMQFDVVLANPPYSIKQWDREAFRSDPWGRNLFGVPPQGRADYAFQQHINKSLKAKSGRCAVLWPHGVLFRQEEEEIRSKLIEADLIECVIGLGPNLFYNSPMEACILVCRTQKSKTRKGKVLFINAVNEVTRERAQSFLTEDHQTRILRAYRSDRDIPGLSRHVAISEIRSMHRSLSIPLYLGSANVAEDTHSKTKPNLNAILADYIHASEELCSKIEKTLPSLARHSTESSVQEKEPLGGPLSRLVARRDGWTRVRFGDVVDNCNDTGKGSGGAPERYIGLEHLEPGSLNVRNFGDTSDGTTFTKVCKPGQVLFGKRRAYQRKIALASFEALVSGDIYVLQPKTSAVLPELLPFICMSDRFFEHAVGTSAGSLSPRTNWSSLANFEFDLPPLEQQRRIVAIFKCASSLHDLRFTKLINLKAAKVPIMNRLFKAEHVIGVRNKIGSWNTGRIRGISDLPAGWRIERLTSKARLESGHTPRKSILSYWHGGDIPWISLHDTKGLKKRHIGKTEQMTTMEGIKNSSARLLPPGTVVFCRDASVGLCSIMQREMSTSQHFANFICGPEIQSEYLYHLFQWMTPVWDELKGGSTFKTIYMPDFQKLEIILPPLEQQKFISETANSLDDAIESLEALLLLDKQLLMSLLNYCI